MFPWLLNHSLGLVILFMVLNEAAIFWLKRDYQEYKVLWLSRGFSVAAIIGRLLQQAAPPLGTALSWASIAFFSLYALLAIGSYVWARTHPEEVDVNDDVFYTGLITLQLGLVILLSFTLWT